jgi:hypothetical protein
MRYKIKRFKDIKKNSFWPALTVLCLALSASEAGPPPAVFGFLMDTTLDGSGNNQYYNQADVAGTHTVSYATDFGSGYAIGTITGGLDPMLHVKVNLNTAAASGQQTDSYVQLDYYFQVNGPAGNVPLNFVGNLDYPNPLPPTTGGTSIQAFINMYDSFGDPTNLAYVRNDGTPPVRLPASGVPGGNLNQPLLVTANSIYHFRFSLQTQALNENSTYEMTLDPTVTIDPAFAAANPGYTLTFSPGFGPAPHLQMQSSGTNVIITWPASAEGYLLQTTSNLTDTNSWTTTTTVPMVVGSMNAVTNPISGSANFYRLKY